MEFSTLARYERAEWPFRRDHVAALLDVYHVYEEAERTRLLDLAQSQWRINHWDQLRSPYEPNDRVGEFAVDAWWLRSRAEELCIYSNSVIPDVVQSQDYAEAILRQAEPAAARVDNAVRQLMARQQQLEEKPPTRLTIVMDEQVLHRPVGGRLVLEQQLDYLARVIERPHVNVQLLPARLGWHPGLDGSFTVCLMERPYPPVAVVEHISGRLVLEASAAERYKAVFEKLKELAIDKVRSAELIQPGGATDTLDEASSAAGHDEPGKAA
ncbi:DUF5753 domain-containing protein [Phytohabitans suffuscus]|uniref:DUF5753 domain-containing protein n=1 Tax=Phytohabitans suffuscus TaxID=624315 RepID=A0A6F8YHF8_9ACTN|nr:DUF5753 domain-containing protein [Phytohabitans suffuscus]BCB85520.1 hypothetical protein Psuf_028330 [Phytohabitans suffuscus]